MNKFMISVLIILLVVGCAKKEETKTPLGFTITELNSPANINSHEPNLYSHIDNTVFMTWIEKPDSITNLYFSILADSVWSEPKLIASGNDWFVNWADFPDFAVSKKGTMLVNILQKSSSGTYSYDVKLLMSHNYGETWSEPFIAHNDSTNSEHGFCSIVALENNNFGVVYLDGRQFENEGGSMSIRYATIDSTGNLISNILLDDQVCDCCQTSAIVNNDGTITAVYRDKTYDKSNKEIRDVSIVTFGNDLEPLPKAVHQDNWNMPGCPVNGPIIDKVENTLAVAWYTKSEDKKAKVLLAISEDGGSTFGMPIRVDNGSPVGRVGVAIDDKNSSILVTWLEEKADSAFVMIREVDFAGKASESKVLATTSAKRASGFPQLSALNEKFVVAYTDIADTSRVKVLLLSRK